MAGTHVELLLAALQGVHDMFGQCLEGMVDSLGDAATVLGGEVLEDVPAPATVERELS